MQSQLLFLLFGILHTKGHEWKPEVWMNENVEISENKVDSCQNFTDEQLGFCKFMIGNLQSLILTSNNVIPKPTEPENCHAREQNHENELKDQLNEARIKLQLVQQRESDLNSRLEMSMLREMEIKSRLEFTQEKEKELNANLEAAMIEMADIKLQLGVLKIMQNHTEHLLQESNSKHYFAVQEKIKSTTQLRLENTILNETNFKCQQQRAHSMARIEKKTLETTTLKAKLETVEGFLNQTKLQLQELHEKYTETVSKLRETNTTVQLMETNCNTRLECLGKEFQTNLTTLQSQLEGQTDKCECTGESTTESTDDAIDLAFPIPETHEEDSMMDSEIPPTSITPMQDNLTLLGLPPGAINLTTGIYLFVNQRVTWSEGRAFCREQGMDLVAIETEQENLVITQHAKSLGDRRADWGRTSGCYSGAQGGFVWLKTGQPVTYTNWYKQSAEPNGNTDSYCIDIKPYTAYWYDFKHNETEPFICEL